MVILVTEAVNTSYRTLHAIGDLFDRKGIPLSIETLSVLMRTITVPNWDNLKMSVIG